MASGDTSATTNTTREFLRSFSVIEDVESESDSDFDELTPIPETPGDGLEDNPENEVDGELHQSKIIPYTSVFRPPVPFSNQRDHCWIPGVSIQVTIVGYDRQPALKMLNPNLYSIKIKHGEHEWMIYRRYKHFRQLHDSLILFRARYRFPLPNKEYHTKRATIRKDIKNLKQRQKKSVRLPLRPEPLISEENIPQRMKQLEQYLQNLVTCKPYKNHPETMKFFEVSNLSFVNKLGVKSKEGLVEKCSGGRRINIQCCGCLQNLHFAGTWNRRWLVIKDSFILYIRPEDGVISDVMLMDSAFSVKSGLSNTGAKHGVLIANYSRKLLLKCWTSRKAKEWAEQIMSVAQKQALDYTLRNRFGSFAPAREESFARWFVDGNSYFEAVADALEKAREEIYITDWWLSPEIYLKRPIVDGDKWRLDVILKRKAEQGVKVFVLLYKEIEAALNIKSIYSKQTLMSKCPQNIKVLRHPDHIPGKGVLLWAHHEKLVIIDQQIAFSGGLDLCYGRWDDDKHRMTDLGSISLKPRNPMGPSLSDSNIHAAEYSSNTELSVVTEDNLSGSDTGPWLVVSQSPQPDRKEGGGGRTSENPQHSTSDAQAVTTEHKLDSSGTAPQHNELAGSDLSSSSKHPCPLTSSGHTKHQDPHQEPERPSGGFSQPIEANVVVKVTSPSDDDENEDATGDTTNASKAHQDSSRHSSHAETSASATDENNSRTRKQSARQPLRQQSSIVDTEGFSDKALEEITQSMQPFKDIHNESYFNVPHDDSNTDNLSIDNINLGFHDDSIDKEIITSANAEDVPKGAKGNSPAHSPKQKRKESNSDKGASASKVKASHLWKRRSKNKSLELIIPEKNGAHKNVDDKEVDETSALQGGNSKGWRKVKKAGKLSSSAKRDKDRLGEQDNQVRPHAGSNSSLGSNSDLMSNEETSAQSMASPKSSGSGQPPATPTTGGSHGAFSFSGAASAMNALRKIMNRKEQNNNEEEDENTSATERGARSNAARRRWKMIFNVTKFETIVRAPQVPERVDESLFYNQNIKHPKTGNRKKLVKSFKEGVDKLTRQGRRDSSELDLKVDRNQLPTPSGMYHTDSEEDILERGLLGSTKLWIGKDYVNFIFRDFVSLDQPFEDFIDRTKFPRMPWHDIGCVLYGKSARDLARHFIGRWNFTKLEKFKKNRDFPLLVPKTSTKCHIPNAIKDITFEVKAQVLRSSSGWSAGLADPEYSIHEAYEHCIENAREYIYIENQFFITQVENSTSVHNCIGKALYKRILRAHRSNSNFKVYIVMPLLPAFEGEFGTNNGAALQAVTHWNYSSICRGGDSLMEKLAKEVPDPNKYIVYCGLRTWDTLDGKLMTELIYVHSKLMIVDDDTVIIGSANINDRSLLGTRDSEIAVMFEDVHKVDVTVNGKQYQAGKFASSLRWTIFREHLGILQETDFVDLTNISSDEFYKEIWIKRAAVNTTCYEKVFKCLPTDNVKNFAELRQYQSTPPLVQTNHEEAVEWLKKVKGYLVLLPLQFLREESLTPKVGQKEALLPTYLWT